MNAPDNKVEVVAVKMPQTLIRAIDDLAARQFRSRSDIVRQGLLKELQANGVCAPAAA
jgi:metal-responsive CopG/Arc/MetJ family transcriptional regulator